MQDQPSNETQDGTELDLGPVVEAVVKAIVSASQSPNLGDALAIRDQLRRLPDGLLTDVLNIVMLKLVSVDPDLCRWFVLDVFLYEADPEGKADVAERINLLLADIQAQQQ